MQFPPSAAAIGNPYIGKFDFQPTFLPFSELQDEPIAQMGFNEPY